MVLAGISGQDQVARETRLEVDFLHCSMNSQRNNRFCTEFAGLHARNLFAPRKNIEPLFSEGLRAPHNCRIENQ